VEQAAELEDAIEEAAVELTAEEAVAVVEAAVEEDESPGA